MGVGRDGSPALAYREVLAGRRGCGEMVIVRVSDAEAMDELRRAVFEPWWAEVVALAAEDGLRLSTTTGHENCDVMCDITACPVAMLAMPGGGTYPAWADWSPRNFERMLLLGWGDTLRAARLRRGIPPKLDLARGRGRGSRTWSAGAVEAAYRDLLAGGYAERRDSSAGEEGPGGRVHAELLWADEVADRAAADDIRVWLVPLAPPLLARPDALPYPRLAPAERLQAALADYGDVLRSARRRAGLEPAA